MHSNSANLKASKIYAENLQKSLAENETGGKTSYRKNGKYEGKSLFSKVVLIDLHYFWLASLDIHEVEQEKQKNIITVCRIASACTGISCSSRNLSQFCSN